MSRPRRSLLQSRRPTRMVAAEDATPDATADEPPAPSSTEPAAPSTEAAAPSTEAAATAEPTASTEAAAPSKASTEPTVRLSDGDEPTVRLERVPRGEETVKLPPAPEPSAAPAPEPAPKLDPRRPTVVFTPFRRMFTRGDRPPVKGERGPWPPDAAIAGGLLVLGLMAVAAGAGVGTFWWLGFALGR